MWAAFLKSHPAVQINTEAIATEVRNRKSRPNLLTLPQMGATKRAVDDQFKALRREARALEAPSRDFAAQDESEAIDEEDLNVYQKAKMQRSSLQLHKNPITATTSKSKGGSKKAKTPANAPITPSEKDDASVSKIQPETCDKEDGGVESETVGGEAASMSTETSS